jgi:putative PEP-CTERM system TPR-repeat lipoprotein
LGAAKSAYREGLSDRAGELIGQAVAANPADPQTRLLAGDLDFMQGRYAEAEAQYSQALGRARNAWLVYYKRGLARLELGRVIEASADFQETEARMPQFAGLHYARGLVAFRTGQFEPAHQELDLYLRLVPQDRDGTYYAAASLYRLGRKAQAEELARRVLAAHPGLVPGVNLLASIRLDAGDPGSAQDLLAPVVRDGEEGAETLRLYARALQALGRAAEAQRMLDRVKSAAPQDLRARAALALSYLQSSQPEAARREASAIVAESPADLQGNTLLVKGYLDQGQVAAAVKAADAFVSAAPSLAQARYVLGIAQNGAGDQAAAREAFERALQLEPGHPDSAFALAALERGRGRRENARALYEQVLEAHPGHTEATAQLAQLDVIAGDKGAAIARLESALAADQANLDLRLNLARGYRSQGQADRAARVLREAPPGVQDDPRALLLGAELDLASGQPYSAVNALETLVAKSPTSAPARLMLAMAFAATGNEAGMQDQLAVGLQLDSASPMAQATLDLIYRGLPSAAAKRALLTRLKEMGGTIPGVALLDARLTFDEGRYQQGLEQLASLQRTSPNDRAVLIELLGGQVRGGDLFAATQTATDWLKEHPKDAQVSGMLAQIYQKRGRTERAIQAYRDLLALEPSHPTAHNNLALLLLEKDPAAALIQAKAARQAAPQDPAIADTLGQALLATGDSKGAMALLAEAFAALSGEPAVALHYAAALAAGGEGARAKAVLAPVMEKTFPEKDRAKALYDTLVER